MSGLKDRLVKLGNENPRILDHVDPMLRTVMASKPYRVKNAQTAKIAHLMKVASKALMDAGHLLEQITEDKTLHAVNNPFPLVAESYNSAYRDSFDEVPYLMEHVADEIEDKGLLFD